MIALSNLTVQTLTTGQSITFDSTVLRTCSSAEGHRQSTPAVKLRVPGIYEVHSLETFPPQQQPLQSSWLLPSAVPRFLVPLWCPLHRQPMSRTTSMRIRSSAMRAESTIPSRLPMSERIQ